MGWRWGVKPRAFSFEIGSKGEQNRENVKSTMRMDTEDVVGSRVQVCSLHQGDGEVGGEVVPILPVSTLGRREEG